MHDSEVSYAIKDDFYVYRVSRWQGETRSYSEESLVGPVMKAIVKANPDTVSWEQGGKVSATVTFARWDDESEDYKPFQPSELEAVQLKVRLQGRSTSIGQTPPYDADAIRAGSMDVDFADLIRTRVASPPAPGTLFELFTDIGGYANIPAVIAII